MVLRLWFATFRCRGKGAMWDNLGVSPSREPTEIGKCSRTLFWKLQVLRYTEVINIRDTHLWCSDCSRSGFIHFDYPKMKWGGWGRVPLRVLTEKAALVTEPDPLCGCSGADGRSRTNTYKQAAARPWCSALLRSVSRAAASRSPSLLRAPSGQLAK